jgi:tRNA dimethylallyltransferase
MNEADNSTKKVILQVVGPTGVGKSRIAVALAGQCDGEIISADSMQVYRGFDIGTDKMTPADMGGMTHYGIDIYEPHEQSSAYRFLQQAWEWCQTIRQRGHLPVICGGTALYMRVMMQGVFPENPDNENVRMLLQDRLLKEGLEPLHLELMRIDPQYAQRIGPGDERRILRALEIIQNTGMTPTQAFTRNVTPFSSYRFIRIGLNLDRETLYKRIEVRVDRMIDLGLVEETRTLLTRYPRHYPPFQAVGYKEMVDHLEGRRTLEETVSLIKQHSRNYAKRQMTWWRKEPDIRWFDPGQIAEISDFVHRELDT